MKRLLNTRVTAAALGAFTLLFCTTPAAASDAPGAEPDTAALAPPVNHESGSIIEVLRADDAGYRLRGYIVRWRESRIYVEGAPDISQAAGDTLDFTVYRQSKDGRKLLRFDATATDAQVAHNETDDTGGSVTLGKGVVEEALDAENGGYRFVAYRVMWHNTPVMVVDVTLRTLHSQGEEINFRVLRTGTGDMRRLSFSLD